jgi:hypothetical protein
MSTFIVAMDSTANRLANLSPGENGMLEQKTTSSDLLDLFFKAVRNLPITTLRDMFATVLANANTNNDADLLADLIVLVFQTRDTRGGKGEKLLFYNMLLELYKNYPETVILLLSEIPNYGYFKDFMNLLEMIAPLQSDLSYGDLRKLQSSMIDLFAKQLLSDKEAIESAKASGAVPKLSLAAKFAPREGKNFKAFYKMLVKRLFPRSKTPNKDYRSLVVELTATLEIPEVFMCAKRYDEINFRKVPSLCLNRHRTAFLNELVTKKGKHSVPLTETQQETGNRFPDDEKRVKCRNTLVKSTVEGKVCGKVLLPHELVSQLMSRRAIQSAESSVYDAQWQKIIDGVLETSAKFVGSDAPQGVNFGKLLPMVDVSASMSGTPMEVAIALGILVSMTCDIAFRNRFITFDSKPTWVDLTGCQSLFDKVKETQIAPWGGSTNFEAAFEMILKAACGARLTPDQIPDLIVFSDMQFNQAGQFGETMYNTMASRFVEEGKKICGSPWPLPKIIFWNLRGDTRGYPVDANQRNVQMLSGFSPSLLKLLLDGEPLVSETVAEDGTVTQQQITPEETLRKALDDPRYFPIRKILYMSGEGLLEKYVFETPSE